MTTYAIKSYEAMQEREIYGYKLSPQERAGIECEIARLKAKSRNERESALLKRFEDAIR